MNDKREQMERILGSKISSFDEEPVPGLVPSPTAEVVYFSSCGSDDLADQMNRLAGHVVPPHAGHGGVVAVKHTLTIPDGQLFHAIKYRGDLEGWRRQIEEGAKGMGLLLARFENGTNFVVSDGRTFSLEECVHGRL